MVLPEPAAHDAHAHAAGWLDEIALSLGLSGGSSLVLVDQAHPARLGDLVRTLRHKWPEIDVHTDPRDLLQLAPGSMFVLVPRAEHADWLNMRRQLFADERFKVVLWCDEATAVALKWKAPDFYDWIAHRQTCPPGPAPFAVSGLRAAFQAKWPVVWTGSDPKHGIEEVIRLVAPTERVSWVEGSEPYERLLERLADPAVVTVCIGSPRQLRRARWAMAEAKRSSKVILVAPGLDCPGFWPVHTRSEDIGSARKAFAEVAVAAPGRLAALLDFEPEAIAQAKALLKIGITQPEIEAAIVDELDPTTGLVRLLEAMGRVVAEHPVLVCEDPLILRNYANRKQVRAAFDIWMKNVKGRALGEGVDARDIGVWAAHATSDFVDDWAKISELRAWTLEAVLRADAVSWLALAVAAVSLGERPLASRWLRRIRATRLPFNLRHIVLTLCDLLRDAQYEKDPMANLALLHDNVNEFERLRQDSKSGCVAIVLWIFTALQLAAFVVAPLPQETNPPPRELLALFILLPFGGALWSSMRSHAIESLGSRGGGEFLSYEIHHARNVQLQLRQAAASLADEDPVGAEDGARSALEHSRTHLGEDHPLYEHAARFFASVVLTSGRAREALERVNPLLSPDRKISAELALVTARILAGTGRAGDAVQVLARLTGAAASADSLLLPTSPAIASSEEPSLDRLLQCPAGALAQNPDAYVALMEALLKQGRYPEALLVARNAVTTFAKDTTPAADKLRARLADLERRMGPAGGATQA